MADKTIRGSRKSTPRGRSTVRKIGMKTFPQTHQNQSNIHLNRLLKR